MGSSATMSPASALVALISSSLASFANSLDSFACASRELRWDRNLRSLICRFVEDLDAGPAAEGRADGATERRVLSSFCAFASETPGFNEDPPFDAFELEAVFEDNGPPLIESRIPLSRRFRLRDTTEFPLAIKAFIVGTYYPSTTRPDRKKAQKKLEERNRRTELRAVRRFSLLPLDSSNTKHASKRAVFEYYYFDPTITVAADA